MPVMHTAQSTTAMHDAPCPSHRDPAPLHAAPCTRHPARARSTLPPAPCTSDTMNIQQMMKQAQQMQERLQKQMAELKVEGNAGGGMVTVVINGAKEVQSLTI